MSKQRSWGLALTPHDLATSQQGPHAPSATTLSRFCVPLVSCQSASCLSRSMVDSGSRLCSSRLCSALRHAPIGANVYPHSADAVPGDYRSTCSAHASSPGEQHRKEQDAHDERDDDDGDDERHLPVGLPVLPNHQSPLQVAALAANGWAELRTACRLPLRDCKRESRKAGAAALTRTLATWNVALTASGGSGLVTLSGSTTTILVDWALSGRQSCHW